jgi:hypothetical protein
MESKMQILVFSILIYILIIGVIGLIGGIFDRELDRVFKKVRELNQDPSLQKIKKKEELIKLFNQYNFQIDEPNENELIGLKRRFNVWWFLFWSSILFIFGSLLYILYYFLVKTPDSIIVELGEYKPKESSVVQLEKLARAFEKREISRAEFEEKKLQILAQE